MSAGALFSGVVFHLPMLAVLIVGVVLVSRRRARIGGRSVLLAQFGLGLLILDTVVQGAWTVAIPLLYRTFDTSVASISTLAALIGLMLAALGTGGAALLIAAVVTRTAPAPFPEPGVSYPV
jgi:Sec-independent protein secretion pathway component TatC